MRRPRPVDLAIAAAVGVAELSGVTFASRHQDQGPPDVLGYGLLALGVASLLWRRDHPRAVLAVTFASTLAYWAQGEPRGPAFLALIVAFVTVVARGDRLAGWLALAAGYVAFLWLPAAVGTTDAPSAADAAGLGAWMLLLGAAAEGLRLRVVRAHERERAREEEARRQVGEERLRIARELHDVLAHNVSLMHVQSSVGLHLIDAEPEQARSALAVIKQTSAETLREMRGVLGALREEGDEAPRAPAPSLARLQELVSNAELAGLPVRVRVEGEPRPLPAAVDLAAYRIVQESLTNVTRHAPGATADVRVAYRDGVVEVQVDDDGPGPGDGTWDVARHGNGITGMGERAAALGGELEIGPRAGGGFRVRAVLPLEASA